MFIENIHFGRLDLSWISYYRKLHRISFAKMSITCFKLKMFKSYIWNLTCRVNDNRIFLSWFFTIFHHFRNVSKERLRRRPVWQDFARTPVKLTTLVFTNYLARQLFGEPRLCISLASRRTRLYVVLNCTAFLILRLTFRWSFLRTAIQTPKVCRLPSRKMFKKTMLSTLTKGVVQFTHKYRLPQVRSIE